jgi:hypothetical protein
VSTGGSSALAAAGLTVVGFVTIVAFFSTTIPILGTINDWVALHLAPATVPVALALRPAAAAGSPVIETASRGG